MAKEYDPLLVIPGSETGVTLATKLAYDLNLKGNHIDNINAMTLKHEMQNRIAEHGLRYIKGKVINSKEEAIAFYDEENLKEVVLKPTYSSSSTSVRICLNKDEMIESLDELFTKTNMFGQELTELVIQEYINGEEYFVNTVSCNGVHRVTMIWKYEKVKTNNGAIIYDTINTVNELDIGEAEMVEYAYKVADAIGIKYGPVHGEYMIDEKGPVLIEVNCRPSGAHMTAEYLDRISGQHETDSILDAYLKPDRFYEERKKPYRPYAYGTVKLFITPKDIIAKSSPMKNISIKLKSHYKTSIDIPFESDKLFVKTTDMMTSSGLVYLVNEDYSELHKDVEFLRKIEKKAFDLVLSEEKEEHNEVDEEKCLKETEAIISTLNKYGTILIVTDQKMHETYLQASLNEVECINGTYDCIFINLNKSIADKKEDELVKIFLNIFTKIKVGGFIFIPEYTYKNIRSKRAGMEALIKTQNLRLELPPQEISNMIIASKTK